MRLLSRWRIPRRSTTLAISTGVALIAFLALALAASPVLCGKLIIWLFAIQSLMVLASLGSFYLNKVIATARYGGGDVQWLTAGGGIVHAEMFPLVERGAPNPVELFQIWLNLPGEDGSCRRLRK